MPYHVTHIRTVASYNKFFTLCHIMLLTYVLLPVKTNSTRNAISCYSHTYCRQLQQIPHTLPYHVTHIRTVASYNKFFTLCHIMLLTYVLSTVKTNYSHSDESCESHNYCCQFQQIQHPLPYHVTHIRIWARYNKLFTLWRIMWIT